MKLLKIYCEVSQGASTFIRTGWKNAFEKAGHTFIFFPEHSNVFDLFNSRGSPDILIGTTYNLNNSLFKLIQNNPQMKVILFGSAYGQLQNEIDLVKYPIDCAKDEEIKRIDLLKKTTGKPDYIFIHTPDFFVDKILGYWKERLGINIHGVMNAADTTIYKKLNDKNNRFNCDIGFVGGYWSYKSRTLEPLLGRLCNDEINNLNIKIFGHGWNVPQFLGSLDFSEDNLLFNNAKICPNISEEHSYIFPDYIERLFKVPAAGGFLISDNVFKLDEIYKFKQVPTFTNYKEMKELIYFYLKNDELRNTVKEMQEKCVLKNHTYFDRVSDMLKYLRMNDESNNILKGKNE